jgi:hypothetical protein
MNKHEKVIAYLLANNAPLAALVGTRIYPVKAAQDAALPFLVYRRDDTNDQQIITGQSKLPFASFEIDYVADNYDTEMALAEAIYNALHRQSGTITSIAVDRILFRGQASHVESDCYHGSQLYSIAVRL